MISLVVNMNRSIDIYEFRVQDDEEDEDNQQCQEGQRSRPSLNNSPEVKRLNTRTRAKNSPLKKPTNQSKEISQFKKKNFIELLNN